ncbi:MAG: nicotinate-nucleotide pyrophosphorylase, partial [Deltaproteobacteria bacterium]|nr:nicotinate-nucleotide pyrophosphorylase [Deltaproteobacteria bacterium]
RRLGLVVKEILPEASLVKPGDIIGHFYGHSKAIVIGEDYLIGCIGKPSGIATAAYQFSQAVGNRPKIVSGGWKKMPFEIKESIRNAVLTGGAHIRITNEPFLYLDKNYIEVFGGIRKCLEAASHLKNHLKAVQLKGKYGDIDDEAIEAVTLGADILFIDTGKLDDINKVAARIKGIGRRDNVEIAFGGDIRIEDIEKLKSTDVDILDIGRAIIDAPLLDLKYEVKGIFNDGS